MRLRLPTIPPVLLVVLSIISVQIGSSAAKDLYSAAAPVTVAWLRITLSAIILLGLTRPRVAGRPASDWVGAAAYGVSIAAMNILFYLSIQRIPIGMAVAFEFLGPLTVAVVGSRRVRDLLWVVLAAAGIAMLGFTPGRLDPLGIFFALAAGVFWGLYIILAGRIGRRWSGISGVAVAMAFGAVLATVAVAFTGQWPASNGHVWLMGGVVALLASVIPYGLEMVALRSVPSAVFGVLMSLEPAAAALFALILLGERLTPLELVAMACVIVASIGSTRSSRTSASEAIE